MDLFSLAAKLTLDTGEYEKGIENARSAAANFAKGLTSVVTAVTTTDRAVNNAADSAETLGAETANAADGVDALRQAESDVARTSDNAADSIGSTADAVSELQDSSESVTRTIGESADSMNDAAGEARDLSRELDRAESEFDDTEGAIDDYTESADDATKSTRKLGDEEEKTTKKTSTFGDTLKAILTSDAIKAGLSAIVNGVKAVGRAFINLGKSAVDAYGNYEQLADGVKKLYGNASKIVMENAKQAYKTSGMSANQYMEQATMFSAALVNSLGGNTKKAAELTDVAMRSIADNFNTFGGDIESVKNAFSGFSKQNFTMLDNLRLGYGGTKSEMERLISDANEYAKTIGEASNLSIDSFADIVTAIDLVQRKQKIAGTTTEEAQKTIQGSLNMTKAAWENLLVGIADDSADFDTLINNLVESATAAGENLIPRVEKIIGGIGKAIEKLLPVIVDRIPAIVSNVAPSLVSAVSSTAKKIFSTLMEYLPQAVSFGADLLINIVNGLISALPQIGQAAVSIVTTLANSIANALPTLLPAAYETVMGFLMALTDPNNLSSLVDGAIALIMGLADGLIAAIPIMAENVPIIVENLATAIIDNTPKLLDAALELMLALAEGLITNLPTILAAQWKIYSAILSALWDFAGTILNWLGELCGNVLSAIGTWFSNIFTDTGSFLSNIWSSVKSFLSNLPENIGFALGFVLGKIFQFGVNTLKWVTTTVPKIITSAVNFVAQLPEKIWNFLVQTISKIVQFGSDMKAKAVKAAADFVVSIVNGFKNLPSKMASIGGNVVKGLWNGIKNVKDWILDKIKGFGSGVLNGIKKALGIASPSKFTKQYGKFLVEGLAIGVEKNTDEAVSSVEKLSSKIKNAFDSDVLSAKFGELPDLNTDISASLTASTTTANEESNTDRLLMMILETLTQLDDGMKDKIKSAVDGMGFNWNDREVGRFVKTYA